MSDFTKEELVDLRLAGMSAKCSMPGQHLRRLLDSREKFQAACVAKDDEIAALQQRLAALEAGRELSVEYLRRTFEHYFSDEGENTRAVERDGNGNYLLMQAHTAWTTWRDAARVFATPQPAPVQAVPEGFEIARSRLDSTDIRVTHMGNSGEGLSGWVSRRHGIEHVTERLLWELADALLSASTTVSSGGAQG